MGAIGFLDDYIKVFKKDKKGLKGKFKIVGQVGLGLIVGFTIVLHPDFNGSRPRVTGDFHIIANETLRKAGFESGDKIIATDNSPIANSISDYQKHSPAKSYTVLRNNGALPAQPIVTIEIPLAERKTIAEQLFGKNDPAFITQTNVPFLKDYVFDYAQLAFWNPDPAGWSAKLIYICIAIFIVTAVSNGVNITDGLDGLAAGTTAIVAITLGLFAYISGNAIFSHYLNITFIPLSGELLVFTTALIGACLAFLWYNSYPAQVFMGDTGSLALGGAIAVLALMVKKELLLPLICGVFFIESLSVILQVSYFKYTKKKYGEGRRIFKMSPLHHHYELNGWHESKIVTRFWIITILLELLAFATLKLR
jgi:phospho-N-acetylmuramoyl-pentapeptide-transferase